VKLRIYHALFSGLNGCIYIYYNGEYDINRTISFSVRYLNKVKSQYKLITV